MNRYTYAYHRPTVYYDPNGHIAWLADLRDSVNNWATERFEASEGLNNTNSYSWLSKGMAGAAGLGAGMAELGALGISTVNYAANQASRGLNKLGIVSDETAAEHTAEVAGTHQSLGQVYDAVSTEEGRSRIASSAVDTLGAAMSGDTGALARTTSIFAPGAAALGATAKMGKAAVNSVKSSKTVIKAVEKAKAKAEQAISTTVESAQNIAQKVDHVAKKVASNMMQPGPGSFGRQMGSVGNVNSSKFIQNIAKNTSNESLQLQKQISIKANKSGAAIHRWLMSGKASQNSRYGRAANIYQSIMNGNGNKNFAKLIRGRFLDRRMNSWMEKTFRTKLPNMQLDQTVAGAGNFLRPDVFIPNIGNRKVIFDFGGPSKLLDISKYKGMADDLFPIIPTSFIP